MNPLFTLRAEDELQLAKFFMDRAADAVLWVNSDLRFLYVNDAACCLLNYSREQLLSMNMYDINPNFCRKVWSEHWKIIKQQGYRTFESLHQTKEGCSFPVEITVNYMEYYGREYGCICVRDITKCKQLEVALQKTNEALECRVQELLAELRKANEQLHHQIAKHKQAELEIQQALQREKDKSELKKQIISVISHELCTPLNIISFCTSAVRRYINKWSKEKKLQYLDRIASAIEQLTQLLDEASFINRAESGKIKIEPNQLDLVQFCHSLVAEIQLSNSSQHTINFVHQSDCSTIWADEKLLLPPLANLLSNAIKYSPAGSAVNLELSCREENVIFQIKDQGIGIPAKDRQHMFEPFHRGSNVGNIPGTGLGLVVAKKFVELHGGQISVASEVGVGTTFTVTLPLGS